MNYDVAGDCPTVSTQDVESRAFSALMYICLTPSKFTASYGLHLKKVYRAFLDPKAMAKWLRAEDRATEDRRS